MRLLWTSSNSYQPLASGPVCSVCAARTRSYPSQCTGCEQIAVLVGLDEQRKRICGPCAGWPVDYRCRSCSGPGVKSWGACVVAASPASASKLSLQVLTATFLINSNPTQPTVFLNEGEQLEQLHRCLADSTIDIDLRGGGALMLLYGLNLTRVLAITRNQICE